MYVDAFCQVLQYVIPVIVEQKKFDFYWNSFLVSDIVAMINGNLPSALFIKPFLKVIGVKILDM
jgi:hypothetical protein